MRSSRKRSDMQLHSSTSSAGGRDRRVGPAMLPAKPQVKAPLIGFRAMGSVAHGDGNSHVQRVGTPTFADRKGPAHSVSTAENRRRAPNRDSVGTPGLGSVVMRLRWWGSALRAGKRKGRWLSPPGLVSVHALGARLTWRPLATAAYPPGTHGNHTAGGGQS